MPRQRKSSQKKEQQQQQQQKVIAMDLIKTDISNMPDPEFKATIIRIAGLEKIMEDIRETLTAEIRDLNTSQAQMKIAITEIQNQLDLMTE